MRIALIRLLSLFMLCAACYGEANELGSIVSGKFPHTQRLEILCWVVPHQDEGYLSQIEVFQTDGAGHASIVWQSTIDSAYSPQIRFVEEIAVDGVPIALVERQTGAASSQLDVIGKVAEHVERLLHIDGFKFDVEQLDGSQLPFLVAHRDANILDVPVIYRWTENRFVEDSASHPAYYRELLAQDKARLSPNSSGAILVNLSRIAILSGDRNEARKILDEALAKERNKGSAANQETLRRIREAQQALADDSRR